MPMGAVRNTRTLIVSRLLLYIFLFLTDMEFTTPPPLPCRNKLGDDRCKVYVEGYKLCNHPKYKEMLAEKCTLACNVCPGTKTCKNKIADDKCAMYKSWGACDRKGTDEKYMKMYCAKACNKC